MKKMIIASFIILSFLASPSVAGAEFRTTPEQWRVFWKQYMDNYYKDQGIRQDAPAPVAAPAASSGPFYRTAREAITHPIPGEPPVGRYLLAQQQRQRAAEQRANTQRLIAFLSIPALALLAFLVFALAKWPFKTLAVVSAIALLAAIAPGLPYFYYQVLRVFIFVSAGVIAVHALDRGQKQWVFVMAVLAVLFNFLYPITLERETWIALDLMAAATFLSSAIALRVEKSKPAPASQ